MPSISDLISVLDGLSPSIKSIEKELRRRQVIAVQTLIDQIDAVEMTPSVIADINLSLKAKNYRLVNTKGHWVLMGRDTAYEQTYASRFEYFLRSSDDKAQGARALLQFTDELSKLELFNQLINEDGINLLDLGAGDGSAALPVAALFNIKGKAKYVAVDRDPAYERNIAAIFGEKSIPHVFYGQDFRKIPHELKAEGANVALISHLYTSTPMSEFFPMVFGMLRNNGIAIMVHSSTESDASIFRDKFPENIKLVTPDHTLGIATAFEEFKLDTVTTSYKSNLVFPVLSAAEWDLLKTTIKQAEYDADYSCLPGNVLKTKNLLEFVISARLEAFDDSEKTRIIDELKAFLATHDYKFASNCKIQVALSPQHTLEFRAQFLQLKERIERMDVSLAIAGSGLTRYSIYPPASAASTIIGSDGPIHALASTTSR